MARNLVLTLTTLLALFLGTELLLRATHWFNARLAWTEPDSLVAWRFTPGRRYWFNQENDHPIAGRINRLGWRDFERTRTKPAGSYRIAVLGDSYVEALQVELDSTFVSRLERELSARWRCPVEAMNFGRSGMTQTEELLTLERDVLPCAPDLVVVLFVPQNDIRDVSPVTADPELRPFFSLAPSGELVLDTSFRSTRGFRIRQHINALKQHSALVSLATERYNVLRRAGGASGPDGGVGAPALSHELRMCTRSPDSTYAVNYIMNKRLLRAMRDACAAHGAGMVLASTPLVYRDSEVAELRDRDPSFDPGFFDRDLKAFADSSGITVVGLQDAFVREYRSTRKPLYWAHWNYLGHCVAARTLAGAINGLRRGSDSAHGDPCK